MKPEFEHRDNTMMRRQNSNFFRSRPSGARRLRVSFDRGGGQNNAFLSECFWWNLATSPGTIVFEPSKLQFCSLAPFGRSQTKG